MDSQKKNKDMSDDRIIELLFLRDERAIQETEAKYGKMLYRIAYNILGDSFDSEECKNDTYLSLWNRIPPVRPTVFSSFIAKIVRDTAINKYKAGCAGKRIPRALVLPIDDLDLSYGTSPEAELDAQELSRLIGGFVKSQLPRRRYIFVARFYFCETMEHIARELGVSTATVYRETERLKEGLSAYLKKNGVYI